MNKQTPGRGARVFGILAGAFGARSARPESRGHSARETNKRGVLASPACIRLFRYETRRLPGRQVSIALIKKMALCLHENHF